MVTLTYVGVFVVILIFFSAGICAMIFSKRITKWIWSWVLPAQERLLKAVGFSEKEIIKLKIMSHLDAQSIIVIWILRVSGLLIAGVTAFIFYILLQNLF